MFVTKSLSCFLEVSLQLSLCTLQMLVGVCHAFTLDTFKINDWGLLGDFNLEGVELVLDKLNLFDDCTCVEICRLDGSGWLHTLESAESSLKLFDVGVVGVKSLV